MSIGDTKIPMPPTKPPRRDIVAEVNRCIEKELGIRVFRDGRMWCAVGAGFKNLQSSPAGFGDTPVRAITALYSIIGERR